MMRAHFLTTVALLSISTAGFAADLPSRRAPAPYVAIAPVFTWTGFYIGGNVGGGSSSYRTLNVGNTPVAAALVGPTRPSNFRTSATGFTGGGQVGYNYQIGQFVIGAEADASYTGFGKTRTFTDAGGATDSVRDSLKFLGTVRGRVGYAFDRVLVYGTGGFAYGDMYARETFGPTAAGLGNFTGSRDQMRTGYTYGGGIEYAIPTGSFFSFLNFFNTSAVTIKAEYLHYSLGRETYNLASTLNGAQNYTARTRDSGDIGRLGVNYKF